MSARSEFDQELESMHLDLIRMGGLIEDAIDRSIMAMEHRDKQLAREIIEGDDRIDEMEHTIESKCLRLLLRQQPVASDLRAVSTALKMVTDMERIGDHASDIADLTLQFRNEPFPHPMEHFPLMASIASEMVKEAVDAFVKSDLEASKRVIARDDEVDSLFETVRRDIVSTVEKTPQCADQAVDYLMVAKYLERIGDHAVNVAEWVIFFLTGEHKDARIL